MIKLLYERFKHNNNKFNLIKSFEFNELTVVNILLNNFLKLNNIRINCIKNLDFYSHYLFSFAFYIQEFKKINSDIIYYRHQLNQNSKKLLNNKYP